MHKNKYQSHEEKSGNVWLNIWDETGSHPQGSIEVEGDTASGYRIIRRGSLLGKGLTGLGRIVLGDAGVYFEKRKDAENFSLVLAMHFSGDLPSKELLDPAIFNGFQSGRLKFSKARTDLFWSGVSHVDPTQGWKELDPEQFLEKLPYASEPLPRDDEDELDMRGYDISEVAEAVLDFYKRSFLTENVELPLHQVVADVLKTKAEDHCEIAAEDRGYVTLLALSMLRDEIPVGWIFPTASDEVERLIPRLWASLPNDVKAYIAECETEASLAREHANKVQAVKDKIVSHLPTALAEDDWEVRTRVNCCAGHLIEVMEGRTGPPTHSEPDYVILMKEFTEKALANEDNAAEWLANNLRSLMR